MKYLMFDRNSNKFFNQSLSLVDNKEDGFIYDDSSDLLKAMSKIDKDLYNPIGISPKSFNYTLKLDYYGNKEYGKRVYSISVDGEQTNDYVWVQDSKDYITQLEAQGHQVEVLN